MANDMLDSLKSEVGSSFTIFKDLSNFEKPFKFFLNNRDKNLNDYTDLIQNMEYVGNLNAATFNEMNNLSLIFNNLNDKLISCKATNIIDLCRFIKQELAPAYQMSPNMSKQIVMSINNVAFVEQIINEGTNLTEGTIKVVMQTLDVGGVLQWSNMKEGDEYELCL